MEPNYLLTTDEIMKLIDEDRALQIIEHSASDLLLWDDEDCKEIPVHFLEHMTPQRLAELIHISSAIPSEFRPDRDVLAHYLWSACDHNAFVTLNEIVVFWDDPMMDTDPEKQRLYDEYSDEFAVYMADGLLGQMWFERNIVGINMGQIVETSAEIAEENSDLYMPEFEFESLVLEGLLTTVLHELRHLQMDANLFLPEEEYPLYLSAEDRVEDYCRTAYEGSPVPHDLISFENETPARLPLAQQIRAAEATCNSVHAKTPQATITTPRSEESR